MRKQILQALAVAALAVSPTGLFAQSDAKPTSCPVEITGADYMRHPTPLPVPDPNATTRERAYGTLDFRYRNTTDKPVRAFHVSARFATREAVRPPLLKTPTDDLVQHYTQGDPLDANSNGSASEEVRVDATTLQWLRLDSVEYQDGSQWTPPQGSDACTYRPPAKPRLAGEQ
jgi:hypothetical protein